MLFRVDQNNKRAKYWAILEETLLKAGREFSFHFTTMDYSAFLHYYLGPLNCQKIIAFCVCNETMWKNLRGCKYFWKALVYDSLFKPYVTQKTFQLFKIKS